MIRTLLAQQLKAQRAYVAWTTVLLAAACGLATYAWSATATEGDMFAYHAAGEVFDRAYLAPTVLVPEGVNANAGDDWGTPLTVDQLSETLADGNAEGANAGARVSLTEAWVQDPSQSPGKVGENSGAWPVNAVALGGSVAWGQLLAQGNPPHAGEVVISASLAQELGVGIGDTLTWGSTQITVDAGSQDTAQDDSVKHEWVPKGTRTVAGLTYDDAVWQGEAWIMDTVFLAMEDPAVAEDVEAAWHEDGNYTLAPVTGLVTWDQPTPAMSSMFPEPQLTDGAWAAGSMQVLPVWLCIIMVGGIVITATATGRSQAQQRAQWTATARALGATRGTIAVATVLEGAVMGAVAAGFGMAGGIFAAQSHLNGVYATLLAPPPIDLHVSLIEVVTITALSVLLGLFITGLPALLASRIPPAAALHDTKAVDEVEFSRRVPIWPVLVGWLVAGGAVAWILTDYSPDSLTPFWIAAIIFAILTFTLMVEGSRRLAVWLGGSLLRRHSPAAIRAGLDMHGHPRQAAALMVVQMITMTGVAGFGAASTVAAIYSEHSDPNYLTYAGGAEAATFLWRNVGIIAVVLVIAAALCATVFAGTQRMSAVDSATAQALGLDPGAVRGATVLRVAMPQALGSVCGAGVGLACGSAVFLVADSWLSIWVQPSQVGVYLLTGGGIVAVLTLINLALIAVASTPWLLTRPRSHVRQDHVTPRHAVGASSTSHRGDS